MPKGVLKDSVYPMRFEADELALLRNLSKQLGLRSVASLIRLFIRNGMGLPTLEQAKNNQFDDLARQLRVTASNLNQMTRAANAGKFRLNKRTEDTLEEMKTLLAASQRLLNDYQDTANLRSLVRAAAHFQTRRESLKSEAGVQKETRGVGDDQFR
ncbi:hypothetical protein RA27_17490 [Ruegeria sp. ANG-R]|uniref:plasmid mobilization relaxosome protein MobC n=1 Tax=Ruegeria sp. ANG-R TaxID=1577903 RepID=UPI00057C9C28|nr:plasmid mobilization relaxosome protein MobC [Ruegeria sp. ANG-R]KIC39842.1 hypothetical protein RA27_17490 [Ruegeria sp. ANG-R]